MSEYPLKRSLAGNVLFLILIAVALFAALAYAVTQSSRSSGDGVSKDKVRIAAATLLQYSTMMEQVVSRLQVINHCSDLEIDFYLAGVTDVDYQHAVENNACKIFHADGGALPYQTIPDEIATTPGDIWRFTGQQYHMAVASGEPELVATAIVTREACIAINDKLGITNPSGNPPVDAHFVYEGNIKFDGGNSGVVGGYAANAYIDVAQLESKRSGCGYNNNDAKYLYFHVLIAR